MTRRDLHFFEGTHRHIDAKFLKGSFLCRVCLQGHQPGRSHVRRRQGRRLCRLRHAEESTREYRSFGITSKLLTSVLWNGF